MPLGYNAGDTDVVSVTISNGTQMSTVACLGSKRLTAIEMPAAWTAGTLTLYGTVLGDGSDSRAVNDGSGSLKTVTVTAGQVTEVPPDFGYALRNIQLQSSVAQGADRVLRLYTREI